MSKIMVVEDDASLREIYSIRITAEGYEVVSAGDGEEALAVAVREKPDLILSDVMMPKISGFDMLDIIRSTPETAKIKVIMMTALSAEDQRQRGERLGADRYLVKSQVGIEDVVNTIHEVLGDKPVSSPAPEASGPVSSAVPNPASAVASAPTSAPTTSPLSTSAPAPEASAPAPEASTPAFSAPTPNTPESEPTTPAPAIPAPTVSEPAVTPPVPSEPIPTTPVTDTQAANESTNPA